MSNVEGGSASGASIARVDPVVTEIVRNGFIAITEEMKTNLMRTAYTMIIYEAQDFTTGVFDANGNTVSIGIGLPMFTRGMSETVKAVLTRIGREQIGVGDIFLTNDAYITGSHLNHMTFVAPVFDEDVLVGFSACMAHWPDVGGTLDGMTSDIWSEGLQLPIVRIHRQGAPNDELLEIIRMNVRIPDQAIGDLNAQIGAVSIGRRRFAELIRRYGRENVLRSIDSIMAQTEMLARSSIRAIPDGVYEAESFLDDDGVDTGRPVPIRVRVIIAGDDITIDLTGISPQVKGFYNSGYATGIACCQVAMKCLTSPRDRPINEGSFRPLKVVLPPGLVVSAVRPAPMRLWMTYPMTIIDTIFKALAPAIPDRIIAGHHADLSMVAVSGHRPDASFYFALDGALGGGWGANKNEDGRTATFCINDGNTQNRPIGQWEAKYPFHIDYYRLRVDSGGAGRTQGGLGTEKLVRSLGTARVNAQMERVRSRPGGLFGGHDGAGNGFGIQQAGKEETVFQTGKVFNKTLKAGDAYIIRVGGGGGYGSPIERPIETIAHDLEEGYITRSRAESCYGIVFGSADDMEIDEAATSRRRAEWAAVPQAPLLARARPDPSAWPIDVDDEGDGRPLNAALLFRMRRCC
ncbi:MAG TPA: hydantoinase B/oxoprolinase family protein [Burkholderiaceae bacterium]|nr:hydantoinase B/oxoprolinase family protein [Burkholderiaceae bacterium]